jgi:hypothetical protein
VLLHVELRGFEAIHRVTRGALSAARTLGELTVVNILVAIRAFLKGHRLLKVPSFMAGQALDALMLSGKGIFGLRVIEFLVYILKRNTLPPASVVTGLAGLGEAAFVRIGVAIGALTESKTNIARFVVSTGRVAFLASDLGVQSGQRIFSFVVIELRNVFPILEVVALLAVRAQSAIVFVFVAGRASLRQPQKRSTSIPHLDAPALRGSDTFRRVALITSQGRVFSFELVAGCSVIEPAGCGHPLHKRKIFTIMFGVAFGASLARSGIQAIRSMKTAMRG